MKKNKLKNKVNPDIIIQTTQDNFKDVLTMSNLKNLALTNIAIAKAEKITINEIQGVYLLTPKDRNQSKQDYSDFWITNCQWMT